MSRAIVCQNCEQFLADKDESGQISYNPRHVNSLVQKIDNDTAIMTLQCPKCGCLTQIIT